MLTRALHAELLARHQAGRPLQLAIAGAGFLGRMLVGQCSRTPGLRVAALADRDPRKAARVLGGAGDRPLRPCATTAELRAAVADGSAAVCGDPLQLTELDVDAVVDCTGDAEFGALLALAALARRRAFFAGAETDATVGPALAVQARANGTLYSGCGGDEHAEAFELVCYARLLGLDVVAAGKFKGFLDRASTPSSVRPWAEQHAQNPYSLSSFADGTKMSIEMAILANATGLVPDVRGMHCPRLPAGEVARVLCDAPGGLLTRAGVVDVVVGAEPSSSVFVVVRSTDAAQQREFAYLKLGQGPAYLLTKPFHLCGTELAPAIAAALVHDLPTIAPAGAPVASVFATAKRDLRRGEILDRIGGTTHYGQLDGAAAVAAEGLLPVGIARGARLRRAVPAGTPIGLGDVEVDCAPAVLQLVAESRALLHESADGAPR